MNTHLRPLARLLVAATLSACGATDSGTPSIHPDAMAAEDAAGGGTGGQAALTDAGPSGGTGGSGGVTPRPDAGPMGGGDGGARADAAAASGGTTPPDAAVSTLDADDDGVPDAMDNCPDAANHGQEDADADGLGDDCDLCPAAPDPDQLDTDGDGRGDACEVPGDDDGDEIGDVSDNCPRTPNTDQADPDDDGVGTACDLCPRAADPDQLDTDGDGLGDACDACPEAPVTGDDHADVDGDGVPVCGGDCDDLNRDRAPGLPERCNALDDDCDGAVDEAFPQLGGRCSSGVGLCNEAGLFVCGPDASVVCNAAPHPPRDEVCNGLDDDCDGETDEGTADCCAPGEARDCGLETGVCAAGTQVCEAARVWGACEGGVGPGVEVCNGQDDDCDGLTDEDQGTTVCGVGVCAHEAAVCVGGRVVACDPFEGARAEQCNGLDDDCDGAVDDDAEGTGVACGAGVGACARDGATVCSGGAVVCDAVPGAPAAEACNGLDDDCDGAVDEDACGSGSCADPYVVPAGGQEATFHITQTSYVGAVCGAPADGVDQVHRWTAPRTGLATFRAVTDYWPAFMAVRDGGCNGGSLACSYENVQWPTNVVQLQVTAGTTYTVILGHGRYDGPIVLTYTLTVTPPP